MRAWSTRAVGTCPGRRSNRILASCDITCQAIACWGRYAVCSRQFAVGSRELAVRINPQDSSFSASLSVLLPAYCLLPTAYWFQSDIGRDLSQRGDDEIYVFAEFDLELYCALVDFVAVHCSCERFVLQFFLPRFGLEVPDSVRPDQRTSHDETCQLVTSVERLCKKRIARDTSVRGVSKYRLPYLFGVAALAENLPAF